MSRKISWGLLRTSGKKGGLYRGQHGEPFLRNTKSEVMAWKGYATKNLGEYIMSYKPVKVSLLIEESK